MKDIIKKKVKGEELEEFEIEKIVNSYTKGLLSDDLMAVFLTSVFINGFSENELLYFTKAMMESGKVLHWRGGIYADKHSTGGVGDKVSFLIAPIMASAGLKVPMISGRKLGHTGGTVDKLESIPGYMVNLSFEEFQKIVDKIGLSIISQTEDLAPADRKIYALRDKLNLVDSIPLIASSIMSKKLAEGINILVLDVKTGKGAFMEKYEDAKELAQKMVSIGKKYGIKVRAHITNMDEPLGEAAGNSLEILECIRILKGEHYPDDLMEVTLTLAKSAFELAGIKEEPQKFIENGKAYEKFKEMIREHGGNLEKVKVAENKMEIKAEKEGYLFLHTKEIGKVINEFKSKNSGCIFRKKSGDKLKKGEVICEVYFEKDEKEIAEKIKRHIEIREEKIERKGMIFDIMG